MFQWSQITWKNNLCLCCDLWYCCLICVPWEVELSIAQLNENHCKHGVFCPPGDLNRYIRSGFCKQSEPRDMRPRHCVWKCCGDANVTRCCPLSHVTSVIDAEWFWKWMLEGVWGGEKGTGVEKDKERNEVDGNRKRGNEKEEEITCQLVPRVLCVKFLCIWLGGKGWSANVKPATCHCLVNKERKKERKDIERRRKKESTFLTK